MMPPRRTLRVPLNTVLLMILLAITASLLFARQSPASDLPSGVWGGVVDDLPSGRAVECVVIRDPGGSVAITCDWPNAIMLPKAE